MSRPYSKTISIITSILAGLVLLFSPSAFAASTASLTLSPSGGSYNVGSSFTAVVHEDSQSLGVNAVQANLTYNPTQLQFVGINTGSSPFNVTAASSGGAGSVSIARGILQGSLTGDQVVGSVSFKVLEPATPASVTFASSSSIVQASNHQDVWDANTVGAAYTLTTSGSPASAAAATTSPTSMIAVHVETPTHQAIVGALVSLDGGPGVRTDTTGVASFPTTTVGTHQLKVSKGGQTKTETITIAAKTSPSLQTFTLQLGSIPLLSVLIWFAIALGLLSVYLLIVARRRHAMTSHV